MAYYQQPNLFSVVYGSSASRRDILLMLQRYYFSNSLYNELLKRISLEDSIKPLGNPVFRSIEFLVSHVWKTDFSNIVTDNESILEPIAQVYKWSNWVHNSNYCVRRSALFGDVVLRVWTKGVNEKGKTPKVIISVIDPLSVSVIRHDDSGNVIYCRIDIPFVDKEDKQFILTEIWDKDTLTHRTWEYEAKEGFKELDDLGSPKTNVSILRTYGIDFIPIAHVPLFDNGGDYGMPSVWPAIDKIDELNRMLSRLNQLVFRYGKPTNAITQESKDDSRPTLPIQIARQSVGDLAANVPMEYDGERFVTLPPNSEMRQLVPDLPYSQILEIIRNLQEEIVNDLPELRHGLLVNSGKELSGKAINSLLSDAISKVLSLRQAFNSCLVKANKIALTLGINCGIWSNIGNYENNDFEHSFQDYPVFDMSAFERAELTARRVESGVPLLFAVKLEGWTEAQIIALEAALELQERRNDKSLSDALELARDSANRRAAIE